MTKRPHVLVFPCPSQGHINGMMSFAEYVAREEQQVRVTFVHSARNLSRLLRNGNAAQQSADRIRLIALPDGLDDRHVQSPDPLPLEVYFRCVSAMVDGLGPLLAELEDAGNAVTCLVSDTLLPGTQMVADAFGIPRVDFWTSSAACFLVCYHLPQLLSRGLLPLPELPEQDVERRRYLEETLVDFIPGLLPFPLGEITKEIQVTDASHPWIQFMLQSFSQVKDANKIFIHSCDQMEGSVFEAAHAELGLPMHPVGPLLPMSGTGASLEPEDEECLQWLNRQEVASVVLVSFGSCAQLTLLEINELLLGLEASQQPFLLVLRRGSYPSSDIADALEKLTLRMVSKYFDHKKQPVLQSVECSQEGLGFVTDWAPQRTVLGHRAVGGFLSHCGWNSVLESVWMGVLLIGCPRGSEQLQNMRFITQNWRVGVALKSDQHNGHEGSGNRGEVLERQAVENAVRTLMQMEHGWELRKRAFEVRQRVRMCVAEGGSSRCQLDEFLKDILL